MVAIVILTIGLLALAALISKTDFNTSRSRYMSTAGLLASEKLEELSRLPPDDPAIQITGGTSVGSLTDDVGPVTVSGTQLSYFDRIFLSSADGKVTVTITKAQGGVSGYFTQDQDPDAGTKDGSWSSTAPVVGAGMLSFERRWFVENNVAGLPVGVRRVTVMVTLLNDAAQPPINFQMSMVRQ